MTDQSIGIPIDIVYRHTYNYLQTYGIGHPNMNPAIQQPAPTIPAEVVALAIPAVATLDIEVDEDHDSDFNATSIRCAGDFEKYLGNDADIDGAVVDRLTVADGVDGQVIHVNFKVSGIPFKSTFAWHPKTKFGGELWVLKTITCDVDFIDAATAHPIRDSIQYVELNDEAVTDVVLVSLGASA